MCCLLASLNIYSTLLHSNAKTPGEWIKAGTQHVRSVLWNSAQTRGPCSEAAFHCWLYRCLQAGLTPRRCLLLAHTQATATAQPAEKPPTPASNKPGKSKGLARGCQKFSMILHQPICVTYTLHRNSVGRALSAQKPFT